MQHKVSCDCYYCTKNQEAKQAQIAALSAERHQQIAEVSR